MQPSWMILTVLPVLPAGLRPVFELPTGMYTSSEFNEHYRLIITRNNRLKRLQTKIAPFFLLQNEKLLLQSAIDDLLDNGKPTPLNQMIKNRPLRCLSDLFCGKEGRFRENLLGKRVDYSGRSVIVVGPGLGLDQCGLPYDMAIELFNPYILRLLSEFEMVGSLTSASEMLSHTTFPILWDILDFLSRIYLIVLNRAPTLHRFGIQAFQPVITTGRAIQLHPLVCPAFNADFDGDQMGVHLPLTLKTQAETYDRLLSANNFLSSATGRPLLTPSQDIVLGWYYLTASNLPKTISAYGYYQNFRDVIKAAESTKLSVHSPIWVKYAGQLVGISMKKSEIRGTRVFKDNTILEIYDELQIRRASNGQILVCYLLTTPGRIVLNELIAAAIYAKPINKFEKFAI
jgi:DNA-directed RNA polymerase subunit beta'